MPGPTTDTAMLEGMTRTEVAVSQLNGDSYTLSVITAGDPTMPRVIYVHGTPGDATNWLDYLSDPVAGWEAASIDRPGFGRSGPNHSVVSLEDQARALEPLLVERRGVKPVLVGHSLGGPIVAKAATMYPDRVGAIVVAAGALDPDLERVLFIQHVGNTALVSWLLPTWAKRSNEELIALEDELRLMQPDLPGIACPVVVIHGTNDSLVPYGNVEFMRTQFAFTPATEFVTLDAGNHFLIWNQQDQTREAIRRAMGLMGAGSIGTEPAPATEPPTAPTTPTTPYPNVEPKP